MFFIRPSPIEFPLPFDGIVQEYFWEQHIVLPFAFLITSLNNGDHGLGCRK